MRTENTVGYLKVKCTTCNNEKLLRAQKCVGRQHEKLQVTFATGLHLPSCANRKSLQTTLAAPPARGVTKLYRNGLLSITGGLLPTP